MPPLIFAYYCSGHGYGHATRVSAFATHLLNLPVADRPTVYITSSAPQHVFADSIALGARYRYAEIDPVIVQPLAYRVDRQKSVDVLTLFLSRKEQILDVERRWLQQIRAHAVLSDAAFLGCLAAKTAGIPSILITNFTFDSVYSYLSTPLLQVDLETAATPDHLSPSHSLSLVPDIPVPPSEVDPLVAHIHQGYRCADLLFLLPGCIPIPAFSLYPALPAPAWVDPASNRFHDHVIESLLRPPGKVPLHPPLPPHTTARAVIAAPLLVRSPTSSPYTPGGRSRLLFSIGVPPHLHDPARTKILIVSFGGQVFRAPSRPQSRSATPTPPSPSTGPSLAASGSITHGVSTPEVPHDRPPSSPPHPHTTPLQPSAVHFNTLPPPPSSISGTPHRHTDTLTHAQDPRIPPPRLATPSHLWIPGAPPASKPSVGAAMSASLIATRSANGDFTKASNQNLSPVITGTSTSPPVTPPFGSVGVPKLATIPPTPNAVDGDGAFDLSVPVSDSRSSSSSSLSSFSSPSEPDTAFPFSPATSPAHLNHQPNGVHGMNGIHGSSADIEIEQLQSVFDPRLLPDESWIAVVCGASKASSSSSEGDGEGDGLPDGFYVAPKDVYMPDLTAVGDVLLGKLGYGTVSECVDACTPFVYVSRPMFIEEHGLRLLLDRDGVGVELSRQSYEAGEWAQAVEEAWARGCEAKARKRAEAALGIGMDVRRAEGMGMARRVVEWTQDWWRRATQVSN